MRILTLAIGVLLTAGCETSTPLHENLIEDAKNQLDVNVNHVDDKWLSVKDSNVLIRKNRANVVMSNDRDFTPTIETSVSRLVNDATLSLRYTKDGVISFPVISVDFKPQVNCSKIMSVGPSAQRVHLIINDKTLNVDAACSIRDASRYVMKPSSVIDYEIIHDEIKTGYLRLPDFGVRIDTSNAKRGVELQMQALHYRLFTGKDYHGKVDLNFEKE